MPSRLLCGWPTAQRLYPTELPRAIDVHPWQHLLSMIMIPALSRTIHQDFRATTGRRVAAVALAVRLYAVDHRGELPATLDALVPTYLVAVPDDPFSGRPFRYIRDAKRPIVYSVGNDGIDDGGIEEDRRLGRTQYGFKGDIVVNLKLQPRKRELETPKTGPASLNGSSQRGGCQVAAECVREQERATAEASLAP